MARPDTATQPPPDRLARALAWSVHFYTAFGAALALAALERTARGEARDAFLLMAAALVVDATDGTLARAARVKQVLPEFDGGRLDDIVDYVNYTLVPVFFALEFRLFPDGAAPWVAGAVVMASAYGFCRLTAKTPDFFFTGFPSYWNVAVFYLYALRTPPAANAALMVLLAVLVFVPIAYLYPSRNPFLRPLTLALGAVWGALMIVLLLDLPHPPRRLVVASLAYPAYYFALSLYLHCTRRTEPAQLAGG